MTAPEHDDLARAFRDVRERFDGTHPEPDATLRQVLVATRTRQKHQRRRVWITMPLAAAIAMMSAWAAATGRLPFLDHVFDRTPKSQVENPAASVSPPARPHGARPAPSVPDEPPPDAPAPIDVPQTQGAEPGTPAPREPRSPEAAGALPSRERTSRGATPSQDEARAPKPREAPAPNVASDTSDLAPPPSASAEPPADPHAALFAEAHRLHFTERDPARALVAWDRYIAEAPSGRFAPEAHYNRALCLIRLGRRDEAASALEPFVRGAYGSYRRREASELLDALQP